MSDRDKVEYAISERFDILSNEEILLILPKSITKDGYWGTAQGFADRWRDVKLVVDDSSVPLYFPQIAERMLKMPKYYGYDKITINAGTAAKIALHYHIIRGKKLPYKMVRKKFAPKTARNLLLYKN